VQGAPRPPHEPASTLTKPSHFPALQLKLQQSNGNVQLAPIGPQKGEPPSTVPKELQTPLVQVELQQSDAELQGAPYGPQNPPSKATKLSQRLLVQE
jgi:hypothetical protein